MSLGEWTHVTAQTGNLIAHCMNRTAAQETASQFTTRTFRGEINIALWNCLAVLKTKTYYDRNFHGKTGQQKNEAWEAKSTPCLCLPQYVSCGKNCCASSCCFKASRNVLLGVLPLRHLEVLLLSFTNATPNATPGRCKQKVTVFVWERFFCGRVQHLHATLLRKTEKHLQSLLCFKKQQCQLLVKCLCLST